MSTTTIILFLLFATVVFGLYYVVPKKFRFIVLLTFSVIFYAISSKFMIFFLLTTVVTIYLAGVLMNKQDEHFNRLKEGLEKEQRKKLKAKIKSKKKLIATLCVVANLLILAVLKYFNFFGSLFEGFFSWFNLSVNVPVLKIILPLGISYYTLSAIGYVIDVYRGKYAGEKNFFKVALFLFYFPQLVEGPFANFDKLAPQLYEGNNFDAQGVSQGVLKVIWGFFKKIVIADRFAIVAGEVFKNFANYNGFIVAFGIVAFTIQLYAEFSGIIDIASGISKMFGINLAKNFQQPFFSGSVNEFWRRWHISLGNWFRDYVFYPVSMSRPLTALNKKIHGKVNSFFEMFIPSIFSLFFVWFFNGLWHGASGKYIVYGLYYYVILILGMVVGAIASLIYKKAKINPNNKALKIVRIIRTLIIVNIGMLIFRATNLTVAWQMFTQLFKGGSWNIIIKDVLDIPDLVMCFVTLIPLITVDFLYEFKIDINQKISNLHLALRMLIWIILILMIIIFGAYGNGYLPVDPIYGGF